MNRGNLAEDPKAGLTSSSRYSRNGGEKNSLLYVDSSSLRKEKREAARKSGKQSNSVKGDHNSNRNRSVGRGLADSHMDRLEVGSDGRLFQVKESSSREIKPRSGRANVSEYNPLLSKSVKLRASRPKTVETKAVKSKAAKMNGAVMPASAVVKAAESTVAEPRATEPKATEQRVTESKATEQKSTEPKATEQKDVLPRAVLEVLLQPRRKKPVNRIDVASTHSEIGTSIDASAEDLSSVDSKSSDVPEAKTEKPVLAEKTAQAEKSAGEEAQANSETTAGEETQGKTEKTVGEETKGKAEKSAGEETQAKAKLPANSEMTDQEIPTASETTDQVTPAVSETTVQAKAAVSETTSETTAQVIPAVSDTASSADSISPLERLAAAAGAAPAAGAAAVALKRDYRAAGFANPLIVSVPKEHFFRRYRAPILAAALAVLTAGYIYTGWHYRNRFYPGTEFFGIDAAEQSVYDVKAAIKDKVDSYSLDVIAREPESIPGDPNRSDLTDNVLTAAEVGMIYQDNGDIDKAMKDQKSWAWPVMMIAQMFDDEEHALQTSYDKNMASEAVRSLDCMKEENMIAPQDAKVVMTDSGAEVQSEVYGTTLDVDKTIEAVNEALDAGATSISLDELGLYKHPKVYSGDISLMQDAMALNKVLGANITMHFGDQTEKIGSKEIRRFLLKEDGKYVLSEDRVRSYVTKLAQKYDTYQKEREFFTSLGTSLILEEGIGDYGWELDQEATFNEILTAIYDKKTTTIDPIYIHEGYYQGTNDIGDTYVEVSLTNQTMWFYKNGQLVVKTPVVTGNPYMGNDTPSGGIWYLKGKMRNQCLVGEGYNSPVDYWMPFNQGVGIHDLQNRGWYGGTIYMGSGSHGCVNTPLAAVKLIYDQIEEGVPVIVYKDESEEALAQVGDPIDSQTINAMIEETYGTVEDDGIGSIVSWTAAAKAQQAQAAANAQAQAASTTGTAAATGTGVTAS